MHTTGTTRDRVRDAARSHAAPVGVAELAERLVMHPSTVRFHLDELERSGDVVRDGTQARGRGRPRVLYRAVPDHAAPDRRYELLAGILASALAGGDEAMTRAGAAGYAWGRAQAQGRATGADAVDRLVDLLDDVGFAPRRRDGRTVDLRNCPFREAVADHGALICGIHSGLMRGALAGWNADVDVAALDPFVEPGVCRARLAASGGEGDQVIVLSEG